MPSLDKSECIATLTRNNQDRKALGRSYMPRAIKLKRKTGSCLSIEMPRTCCKWAYT